MEAAVEELLARLRAAAGGEGALIVRHRILRVATENLRDDGNRRVSVDPFERQVLTVRQGERQGHHEDEDERGHGAERGDNEGPALTQPARKYASRACADAMG